MEQNSQPAEVSQEEHRKKLKQAIFQLHSQITKGCSRKYCYNIFCCKNKLSNSIKYANKTDTDIITDCISQITKKPVSTNPNNAELNNNSLFCWFSEESKFTEEFLNSFNLNDDYDFTEAIAKGQFPKINININKLIESFKSSSIEGPSNTLEANLKRFNSFFNEFLDLFNVKELNMEMTEQFANMIVYLFHYNMKALIYVLYHPSFFLGDKMVNDFIIFFENYRGIKDFAKKSINFIRTQTVDYDIKKDYTAAFEDLKGSPEQFKKVISSCQNFFTLILFNIGANNNPEEEDDEDENMTFDEKMLNLMKQFVKIFKTFFNYNQTYSLISYKEFYNDGLSKNLKFSRECKIYNKILKGEYVDKKPFCLISYIWLFDAAAKNEIICYFNYNIQRENMLSSLSNIIPILSGGGIQGIFFNLKIRRDNIIEDTLNAVSSSTVNLKKQLKVKFENEQGIDEGGVRKEFFLLLVRQIFDAKYGMFSYNENTRFFWFNLYTFEEKLKYELIGIILGLALFNNVILDIKFPIVVYKKLLNIPLTLADMKECDPDLYQTLTYLKNTTDDNIKEVFNVNFTVVVDRFGEKIEIPLKENGENIWIDNNNKEEYIELYLDWFFNKSIEEFFNYFKNGFYRVCDKGLAKLLNPEELELIICGTQLLDFVELEKSTKYEDGYEKNSVTCTLLWEILHTFTEDEKKKFLFFLTGCDRAPINGLGSLIIIISRYGPDSDKLPCAHTCFNHLLLPDYMNKDKLKRLLLIAISNSEGFGMI